MLHFTHHLIAHGWNWPNYENVFDFVMTFLLFPLQATTALMRPMSEFSIQQMAAGGWRFGVSHRWGIDDWHTKRDVSTATRSPTLRAEATPGPLWCASKRAAAIPEGCHFPLCEWVAVGRGLSPSGPGPRRSLKVPVSGPRRGRKTCSRGGQRALWSRIPELLRHCPHTLDQNIWSSRAKRCMRPQHHVSIHAYRCAWCIVNTWEIIN